jgi:GntR family transcriptional repressor for pyruvate dehydrogenase complex
MTGIEWGLSRETTTERVIGRLKELITEGELKPGEKLPPERELTSLLGVSRPVLREALQALSALRLLRVRHGDGVYVTSLEPDLLVEPLRVVLSLDPTAIEQIYEARQVLEVGIAGLAARRMTPEMESQFDEILAEAQANVDDPKAFSRIDLELHETIVDMVTNPFLTVAMKSLNELSRSSREFTCTVPGVTPRALEEHRRIVGALKARDGRAARRAMREHLENVLAAWESAKGSTGSNENRGEVAERE